MEGFGLGSGFGTCGFELLRGVVVVAVEGGDSRLVFFLGLAADFWRVFALVSRADWNVEADNGSGFNVAEGLGFGFDVDAFRLAFIG